MNKIIFFYIRVYLCIKFWYFPSQFNSNYRIRFNHLMRYSHFCGFKLEYQNLRNVIEFASVKIQKLSWVLFTRNLYQVVLPNYLTLLNIKYV